MSARHRCVALVSGGKDSCYAMQLAAQQGGHEVVALANLLPGEGQPDEMDSYMYQTVGHQLVESYTVCMGVPLFRHRIRGSSKKQDLQYTQTQGDEVEDLATLLAYVKAALPEVTAVSSGAIASDYQRLRVEHVCARLGLVSLAYMWHQPQHHLLRGMVDGQLHAIIIKVAALGLDPYKHLGKSIAQLQPYLQRLNSLYGSNVCGEGGEYETLTLDCPAFKHGRIVMDEFEVVTCSGGSIAQVGYLHPKRFHVEPKSSEGAAPPGLPAGNVHMVFNGWVPPLTSPPPKVPVPPTPHESTPSSPAAVAVHSAGGEHLQVSCWARTHEAGAPSAQPSAENACAALQSALQALVHTLADLGLSLHHALFVHLDVSNMAHFAPLNAIYSSFFPAARPPSRACVQVPLPEGMPASVTVLLARHCAAPEQQVTQNSHTCDLSSAKGGEGCEKRVLHVQSISGWAPSCIGPYSQATTYRGITHVAGAIPLVPSTMAVVSPDAHLQTLLAFANAQAVAIATGSCLLRACLSTVVYVAADAEPDAKAAIQHTASQIRSRGLPSPAKLQAFLDCLKSGSSVQTPATSKQTNAPSTAGDAVERLLSQHHHGRTTGGCVGNNSSSCIDHSTGDAGGVESEEASEGEGSDDEDDEGQPDPYLCAPQIRPGEAFGGHVVFVEVPVLPRSCLVEVQPTLLDIRWLQSKTHREHRSSSSSSSSSKSDSEDRQAPVGSGSQPGAPLAEGSTVECQPQCLNAQQQHQHQQQQPLHRPDTVSHCSDVEASTQGLTEGCCSVRSHCCYSSSIVSLLLCLQPDAFEVPQLSHKLAARIRAGLAQHGCSPQHVVQIRGWYDCNKVPADKAEILQEQEHGPQLTWTWVPTSGLDASHGTESSAVVEVVASVL